MDTVYDVEQIEINKEKMNTGTGQNKGLETVGKLKNFSILGEESKKTEKIPVADRFTA